MVACRPAYLWSLFGILNIIEMILSLLTFAISFGGQYRWNSTGGGWVEFVGILSLVVIAIYFTLHVLDLVPAFFSQYYVELITYLILAVMFMISGIIAAARAYDNCVKATSFFAFAAMFVLSIDVGIRIFRRMQSDYPPTQTADHQPETPTNDVPS